MLEKVKFSEQGLVVATAPEDNSAELYASSRQILWHKDKAPNNTQKLKQLLSNYNRETILTKAKQNAQPTTAMRQIAFSIY